MEKGTGERTAEPTRAAHDADTFVTTLALTLRSVAIYPASHPRVTGAATDLVKMFAQGLASRRATSIGQHGDQLWVDGRAIDANDGHAVWLLQRLRDAGLRGFTFEPTCTTEDVVEFALTLNQARSRNGQAFLSLWPQAHPRIRGHDLVFSGTFRDAADGGSLGPGAPSAGAVTKLDATEQQRHLAVLERLGKDTRLEQRLGAIQAACGVDEAIGHELDLFSAIADLLPADVAAHPELAAEKVVEVLQALERELPAALNDGKHIDEGELLRTALRVARKYFQTEAPELPLRHNLPSGRPGDEGIEADLELLLQELQGLPDCRKARLPAATELTNTAPKIQRELFGIYLHIFANSEREELRDIAGKRITAALRNMDLGLLACIAAYLAEPGSTGAIPERRRTQLLGMMVTAGQAQTVRDYGYVDAAFVTRGYPQSLAIAAKVLMSRSEDLQQFRRGLDALSPMLAMGEMRTPAEIEVLAATEVTDALLRIGGKVVLPLLTAAAGQCTADIYPRLVSYTLRLELPSPERAVLEAIQPPQDVPRAFLQSLLECACKARFGAEVRTASEEVLRTYVLGGLDELPIAQLVEAIARLRHVPSPEVETLLGELARRGRWTQFGARARAIRTAASETLAATGSQGRL